MLAESVDLVEQEVHVIEIVLLALDHEAEHVGDILLEALALVGRQRVVLNQDGTVLLLGSVQVLVDKVLGIVIPLLRVLHVVIRSVPEADVDAHGLMDHLEVRAGLDLISDVASIVKCSVCNLAHSLDAVLLQREEELDTVSTTAAEYGLVTDVVLGSRVIIE